MPLTKLQTSELKLGDVVQLDTSVDASGRFCRIRVIGRMDASEYRVAAARFLEHPGVLPGIGIVYDLRDAQVSHLTAAGGNQE